MLLSPGLRRTLVACCFFLPLTACQLLPAKSGDNEPQQTFSAEQQQQANTTASDVFADYSSWQLENSPILASRLGIQGQFGWDDLSPEAQDKRSADRQVLRNRLKTIDEAALTPQNRASYQTLLNQLEFDLLRAPLNLLADPLAANNNLLFQVDDILLNHHPVRNIEDAHDYISRIEALPQLMQRWQEQLQQRQQAGYPLLQSSLSDNLALARQHQQQARQGEGWLWQDFNTKLAALTLYPSSEKILLSKMRKALQRQAAGAYGNIAAELQRQLSSASAHTALLEHNQGMRYYQLLLNFHAQTELDASQLFQQTEQQRTGLIQQLLDQARLLGFSTANKPASEQLADFFIWLPQQTSQDPLLQPPSQPADYQRETLQQLAAQLPFHFTQLPASALAINRLSGSTSWPQNAFAYQPGFNGQAALLNWRPQLSRTFSRADMTLRNAAYAVPGLHLQYALAQENDDLPDFRSQPYLGRFNPGWMLYAQQLTAVFDTSNPWLRLAVRLKLLQAASLAATDLGIHAKGWNRLQALDYLTRQGGLSEVQAQHHITRLLQQPAMAIARWSGFQQLQQLHIRTELVFKKQGMVFDDAAFHSTLLRQGAVPVTVAGQLLEQWAAEQAEIARQRVSSKEQTSEAQP